LGGLEPKKPPQGDRANLTAEVALARTTRARATFVQSPLQEKRISLPSHGRWRGVHLKDVLDNVGLKKEAIEIVFDGADGPVVDRQDTRLHQEHPRVEGHRRHHAHFPLQTKGKQTVMARASNVIGETQTAELILNPAG
jgi:DMSO/TMAO reductase YedYZ molybdopterin-dependent catalytic subunit